MPMVSPVVPPNVWKLIAKANNDDSHNQRLMADIDRIVAEAQTEEDDE